MITLETITLGLTLTRLDPTGVRSLINAQHEIVELRCN